MEKKNKIIFSLNSLLRFKQLKRELANLLEQFRIYHYNLWNPFIRLDFLIST